MDIQAAILPTENCPKGPAKGSALINTVDLISITVHDTVHGTTCPSMISPQSNSGSSFKYHGTRTAFGSNGSGDEGVLQRLGYRIPDLSLLALTTVGLLTLIVCFWPRAPGITVDNATLTSFSVQTDLEPGTFLPRFQLDVALRLALSVSNPNFVAFHYDRVTSVIAYKDMQIGDVGSVTAGRVPGRKTHSMEADLSVTGLDLLGKGVEMLHDSIQGHVPIRLLSDVSGGVEIGFWTIPLRLHVICTMAVNPLDQQVEGTSCEASVRR
eukprot:TRINITY_DN26433_c0_g1_i1.p1 TRINITY_DN26433_c0_g1~~TRINITY_DN26433_c0_g1_i1.p1  ORF type:complete len:268 (-),score=8.97 TRINITY_DN26433_c0_g1_i1:635-1438(-)